MHRRLIVLCRPSAAPSPLTAAHDQVSLRALLFWKEGVPGSLQLSARMPVLRVRLHRRRFVHACASSQAGRCWLCTGSGCCSLHIRYPASSCRDPLRPSTCRAMERTARRQQRATNDGCGLLWSALPSLLIRLPFVLPFHAHGFRSLCSPAPKLHSSAFAVCALTSTSPHFDWALRSPHILASQPAHKLKHHTGHLLSEAPELGVWSCCQGTTDVTSKARRQHLVTPGVLSPHSHLLGVYLREQLHCKGLHLSHLPTYTQLSLLAAAESGAGLSPS